MTNIQGNILKQAILFPDWSDSVVYSTEEPQPQILMADDQVKILIAGLEPGQRIPEHPEATSMYHILEGSGWMTVDGERWPVHPGATVVMPAGSVRGVEAETRLAFLVTRVS